MQYYYVESTPEYIIRDILDEILYDANRIYDKSKKMHYLNEGCGFDIETSKISTDKGNVAYCYHWQFGIGNYAIMGRYLSTMESFFKLFKSRLDELLPNTYVMVLDANLGYEWQFCKHYWANIGITDIFAKERRAPIYITVDKFVFREVLGLWGHSLAQIAKNHCGMEKLVGDLDYDKIRVSSTLMDDKEIGYCVRDVEILVMLGRKIFKTYYGKKSRMPYTSTGIVRDEIKKEIGKDLKAVRKKIESWMPCESDYELFRTKLFKGGTCGSNIIHMDKTIANVVGADITSDYPFQMLSKKYPMGKAEVVDNTQFMADKKPYIAIIAFYKFKSKTSHALLSAHKVLNTKEIHDHENTVLDNNRLQYAERAVFIINDVEFNSIKKAYKWEHAYVQKCWKFNEGYDFLPQYIRKVVLEWYLKKERLKAEHSETQEYKDAKAFVNGIFGMMCTALYMEEFKFIEDECTINVEVNENGDRQLKSYEECCKYLFLSPYWGFWITSYAREQLWDVITRYPHCIIQYDTDSVYFVDGSDEAKKLRKYLENFNRVTSNQNYVRFLKEERLLSIGTWDFTKTFKRFKALGAKRYMYKKSDGEIRVVVAGLRISKKDERSTLLHMLDYVNDRDGTNIDPFDFFTDGMLIDAEHSEKLASKYIDDFYIVNYNGEKLEIPSCIVLEPIDFHMTLGKDHRDLMLAMKRSIENTTDRSVYDIWRKMQKSGTSRMTPILASSTTGI